MTHSLRKRREDVGGSLTGTQSRLTALPTGMGPHMDMATLLEKQSAEDQENRQARQRKRGPQNKG